MKCPSVMLLLVLVLTILTVFLVPKSDALTITIKRRMRIFRTEKKTRHANTVRHPRGRKLNILKNTLKKKDKIRKRVPGMNGKQRLHFMVKRPEGIFLEDSTIIGKA